MLIVLGWFPLRFSRFTFSVLDRITIQFYTVVCVQRIARNSLDTADNVSTSSVMNFVPLYS